MFRIIRLLLLAMCFGVIGCDDSKTEAATAEFRLVSVTPATGTVVSPGTVEVTFEFDSPVEIVDASRITHNGSAVGKAYAVAGFVKVAIGVRPGSVNNVEIAPGAIALYSQGVTNTETYSTSLVVNEQTSALSTEAQRLLDFMHEIDGKKMMSGVSACVNWNQNEARWVYKHTGRYPVINNFDFIHDVYSSPGGWIDYSNSTPAVSWANENGVVGAMWHWGQLTNDGSTYTCTPGSGPTQTSFHPSDIFNPESDGYKKMIADIDRVAEWMKPLARLRIPILWRPLHEAQGNWKENSDGAEWRKAWFWWGIDGPEACVEIWKVMYDRMVNYHGLTNLIWVYNSGDSLLWYPGDKYVDVVGYDFYNSSMEDMERWYYFMKEHFPGKLLAICECGSIPLLSEQWEKGLHWNYFMPWWDNARTDNVNSSEFESKEHRNADIDFWNDAWNCDFMLSRDQMPSFRD